MMEAEYYRCVRCERLTRNKYDGPMQAKRDSGLYYKWRDMPDGADFTTDDGNISSSWWERLIIVCPWCCRADEDLKWKAYWWKSLEDLQQK